MGLLLCFVEVACGETHTAALALDGRCTRGALTGHGVVVFVEVACGETHTAALALDGQVYTWGADGAWGCCVC